MSYTPIDTNLGVGENMVSPVPNPHPNPEGPRTHSEYAGIYPKFHIQRADGTPLDPNATHFVLRVDNDPAAQSALRLYSRLIKGAAPQLAKDLEALLDTYNPKEAFLTCELCGATDETVDYIEASECALCAECWEGGELDE